MEITDPSFSREGLQDADPVPTNDRFSTCSQYPSLTDELLHDGDVRAFRDAMQSSKSASPAVSPSAPSAPSVSSTVSTVSSLFDAVKPEDFHWEPRPFGTKPRESAPLLHHNLESGEAIRSDDEPPLKSPQEAPALVAVDRSFLTPVPSSVSDSAEITPASEAAAPLNGEVLDRLVARLLVSTPENGSSAVRITLSDTSALRGTDITLTRQGDGTLRVSLINSDPALCGALAAAQGQLATQLSASEKRPVFVSVSRSSDDASTDERASFPKTRRRPDTAFGQL